MADSRALLEAAYPPWGSGRLEHRLRADQHHRATAAAFMAVAAGRMTFMAPSTLVSNALRQSST